MIKLLLSIISLMAGYIFLSYEYLDSFIYFPSFIIVTSCLVSAFIIGSNCSARIKLMQSMLIVTSIISPLFSIVLMLQNSSSWTDIGPDLATAILTPIYSLLLYLIIKLIEYSR